jgi:predicted nucleic acid binding AN1-type Zn finger protein
MQRDYLNFYCNVCQKNLCKEHYHHPVSCPFEIQKNKIENEENNLKIKFSKKETILYCNLSTCNAGIFNSIGYECKSCKLIFCLKHRIECDHCCKLKKVSLKDKYIENKNKFKEKLEQLKNKK